MQEHKQALAELSKILPTAAILVRDSSDTDTASESEEAGHFPQQTYSSCECHGDAALEIKCP